MGKIRVTGRVRVTGKVRVTGLGRLRKHLAKPRGTTSTDGTSAKS